MCKKLRATLKIKKRKKLEGSGGSSWAAVEAAAGTAEAGTGYWSYCCRVARLMKQQQYVNPETYFRVCLALPLLFQSRSLPLSLSSFLAFPPSLVPFQLITTLNYCLLFELLYEWLDSSRYTATISCSCSAENR